MASSLDAVLQISIHALREEGDPGSADGCKYRLYFNPRPPRGGRRVKLCITVDAVNISIHALREEGDKSIPGNGLPYQNFNPRPPRGGRPQSGEKIHHVCSIIHTCAQFEKELYEGSGEMQNKSC